MEQNEPRVVYSERNEPKRTVVRSDGALYVLLLIGTFGAIFLGRWLANRLGVRQLYVQIGLYAVLLGAGYLIYRLRLIDYLYELTDAALVVKQAVGSKQKLLETVPFDTIREIGPFRETDAKPTAHTYRGAKEKTTAVWFLRDGEEHVLLLNATDLLKERLAEARHAGN